VIKVEKLLFIILEPLRPLDTSPINRGGVMPPLPASRIAFGDLLVVWHISSKLGFALTPASVPPINRRRIWCVDYVLVCFLELNRMLKMGMLKGVFFMRIFWKYLIFWIFGEYGFSRRSRQSRRFAI
jgi:hypothetical protein